MTANEPMDFSLQCEFFELLKFAERCGRVCVILHIKETNSLPEPFIRSLTTQALFLKDYGGDLKVVTKSEHLKNCFKLHVPYKEIEIYDSETQALDQFALEMKR